jgi:DNA end-binding protein Ku
MPRPMWRGAISFGLVSVPVKLFSAISQKEVHFHMLHDRDGGRIRFKRVCEADGREVPYEHIVHGYEIARGHHVMITDEELAALDPQATRTIDIEDFVGLDEIDPIYWERSYHLVPDRGGEKAYVLLTQAMKKTGRVGVARVVMRSKQYLCTLRPYQGRGLLLSTMQYDDEIVSQDDLEGLPSGVRPTERELSMAEQLIASLTSRFDASKYRDDYREKVQALIEQKAEGKQVMAAPEVERPARVVDLIEALKASLAAGSGSAAPVAKPRRRSGARHGATRPGRKAAAPTRKRTVRTGRRRPAGAEETAGSGR